MVDRGQFLNSRGAMVVDEGANKIGSVEDIYLDTDTNQPEWIAVKTGLVGGVSFVPLANASLEGNDIRVPYDKDRIKGSPSVKSDRELSHEEEAELYRYYGLSYDREAGTGTYDEGRDTSTDDAMTRSEEELQVGKTRQERGRARLRKYVVTENVQQTVPVQREEVRVEREPITDANIDSATSGPDISEDEHEVVLSEERPVVEKRTVPKERVRLTKDTVTDEQQVSEELRKEQIEQEGDLRS
jgi:uncharacterized protein (TIGR02271 family)